MGAAATALIATPALAETLREAMVKAYNTSPTLQAQRAAQRATDENVEIQRAGGLPNASGTGSYSESLDAQGNSFTNPQRYITGTLQAALPIYAGGLVKYGVAGAKTRVEAGRDTLRGVESNLFVSVVGAYQDVIRDEAIVGLNQQNVHALDVNLQATRDRFQVGDLTRTDVAQSEARLAVARSQLQQAQAQLISSRETYVRVIGAPPGVLEDAPALPTLPAAPDDAVEVALKNNPVLLAAQKNSDATRYDVRVAEAARLPRLNVVAGGNYTNYLDSLGVGTFSTAGLAVTQYGLAATAGLQLSVPLYQGGRPGAQVRQAQALRSQSLEQVTDTERGVIAQTRAAYAIWQSALEVIRSSETAVSANRLSLEGVRAENSVGTRTILDILNAEQELLNSEVTLVTARHDAYVAGFALLAAMGQAEARDLGLEGGALYDPIANYKRVHAKYSDWSTDPDPRPVGTRTAATPAQTATVTKPLDPEFNQPVDTDTPTPTAAAKPKPHD